MLELYVLRMADPIRLGGLGMWEGRKEMFYLTTHSTFVLIYGYVASDM